MPIPGEIDGRIVAERELRKSIRTNRDNAMFDLAVGASGILWSGVGLGFYERPGGILDHFVLLGIGDLNFTN